MYIHASFLDLRPEDYGIKDLIRREIGDKDWISIKDVLSLLKTARPGFLERNKITKWMKLQGILRYMFPEDFTFCKVKVSPAGEGGCR